MLKKAVAAVEELFAKVEADLTEAEKDVKEKIIMLFFGKEEKAEGENDSETAKSESTAPSTGNISASGEAGAEAGAISEGSASGDTAKTSDQAGS